MRKHLGWLYISQHYLCFYSKVFGLKIKVLSLFEMITDRHMSSVRPKMIYLVHHHTHYTKNIQLPTQLTTNNHNFHDSFIYFILYLITGSIAIIIIEQVEKNR